MDVIFSFTSSYLLSELLEVNATYRHPTAYDARLEYIGLAAHVSSRNRKKHINPP